MKDALPVAVFFAVLSSRVLSAPKSSLESRSCSPFTFEGIALNAVDTALDLALVPGRVGPCSENHGAVMLAE